MKVDGEIAGLLTEAGIVENMKLVVGWLVACWLNVASFHVGQLDVEWFDAVMVGKGVMVSRICWFCSAGFEVAVPSQGPADSAWISSLRMAALQSSGMSKSWTRCIFAGIQELN